ncbi:S24 family peptidase [Flavobacterium sp. JAS]|uniref:S24 family peptidase n=1 Tax=Flavobacterium sp. JAS TaxID=2897329 RepID=UPI001E35CED8|nr:S24 family peptidase [Flavobacterium sp. JAS]MCD0469774.1 S24 family peptidase [Flavobacterium sp. JAS]
MKAIERFYQYLEYKGVKPTRYEKDNGLSNGYLGTQLKRNGNLGEDILNKIIDNCLDLNPVWLLTGRENMIKINNYTENFERNDLNYFNESPSEIFKITKGETIQKQSIPLYNMQASTSMATLFKEGDADKSIDKIVIPNLPKCDGAVYVGSDSMYPLLKSGDIIIYKKVAAIIENIYWGEMYLVSLINDDGDEFVMPKWVQKSEKGDEFIKLVSENKQHQPKDLHISNIKGLALIKASVRINVTY